ncbi:hypothetical protein MWU75_19515 [Ornithinimicrobium sp. F0845]|uniref:hypothetical protein n=1 Tax=Ornithinimicrobium sp. F0845 TaxID=2926412 RepID=UPI001FF52C27|nr:hypothetical protein [Ornithinimicrobium sp. F0845]MCK0114330.1 hypothetical protein [Ornithinimicrobium sp. F0845]
MSTHSQLNYGVPGSLATLTRFTCPRQEANPLMFRARPSTRRHTRRHVRLRAALVAPLRVAVPLLVVGLLAGCSGTPDSEQPVVTSATDDSAGAGTDPTGAPEEDQAAAGDDTGSTAAPGSGGAASAQLQPDGSILLDGDHASFLMPSQNVACVMRPDQVLCQIDGKQYDAKDRDITPEAFEGCTPSTADAMSVGGGADPAWACLPYDLRPGTDVTQGGAWAGPGLGATTDWEGATVAVLPYGTTVRLGNVSCSSDRLGVDCTDLVSGHGFQLARERYTTH